MQILNLHRIEVSIFASHPPHQRQLAKVFIDPKAGLLASPAGFSNKATRCNAGFSHRVLLKKIHLAFLPLTPKAPSA
jgi:hypothetical protein